MNPLEIANLIMTIVLAIIGLCLAHSYRRRLRLRVSGQRLSAYRTRTLWSKMSFATPVRVSEWMHKPLTQEEWERLFQEFTAWYYENGNGMFLGDSTRCLYLRVKDNLVCPIEHYEPGSIREKLLAMTPEEQEQARGILPIRHRSVLRNRMKADLDVYGLPYHVDLDEDDKALLRRCGEDPSKKPWMRRSSQVRFVRTKIGGAKDDGIE
jgi:hypothetical protein